MKLKNIMRANFINEKLTNFTEDSDPVKDMGIGAKPRDVLNLFCEEFHKEFGIFAYPDECGVDYYSKTGEIYRLGDESFEDLKNPVVKLLTSPKHELLFAMNDKAANYIVKGAKWGWFYYVGGTPKYLKDAYELRDVFKQIFKLNSIGDKTLDESIKRYELYLKTIKKMKELHA